MQAISLYWFAAQQQTSTLRRQKISLFDVEFSADFNDFNKTSCCLFFNNKDTRTTSLTSF